jgi:hypothetical protein
VPHDGPVIPPSGDLPPVTLPPGDGGGFVTNGPFANMTVNLGPVIPLDGTAPGTLGGLGWNPRRLKRDIGSALTTRYANYTAILSKYNRLLHFAYMLIRQIYYGHPIWDSIVSFKKVSLPPSRLAHTEPVIGRSGRFFHHFVEKAAYIPKWRSRCRCVYLSG